MSPSRGSVRRLLLSANVGNWTGTASRSSSHYHLSPSSSRLLSTPAARTRESRAQETSSGSSNSEHHPLGIDTSLFESSTLEYSEQTAAYSSDLHALQVGPSQLLASLLVSSTKDATKTLQELRKLETSLDYAFDYARPARQCVNEGDFQGALSWLDMVPDYYSSRPEAIQESSQACTDIAAMLVNMINANAKPHLVCLALLKVISKGYIDSDDKLGKSVFQTTTWLVRHGKVANQAEDQEWSWQLWQSIVRLSRAAKSRQTQSTSRLTMEQGGMSADLVARLARLYNACIRALTLSGQHKVALYWVRQSESISSDRINTTGLTKLHPFTWRMFMEEVLDDDSPASAVVKAQAASLLPALRDRAVTVASSETSTLIREAEGIVLDRSTVTLTADRSLDDKVLDLLSHDDVKASITLLLRGLKDVSPTSNWSRIPKATTLAAVREAVVDADTDGKLALEKYLKRLGATRGARGLIPFSEMLILHQRGKHVTCLEFCLSNFHCRDVQELASVLEVKGLSQKTEEKRFKLHENRYANYLALKSMVSLCKKDFFKMYTLYQAWLELTSQHVTQGRRTTAEEVSFDAVTSTDGVFEDVNLEYLYNPEHDLAMETDHSSLVLYETPPVLKPTIIYFNLFLKALPKALSVSALSLSSSPSSSSPSVRARLLQAGGDVQKMTMDLAFEILRDMEKYSVEPNVSTWSILLTLMARNITAPLPPWSQSTTREGEVVRDNKGNNINITDQWTRIWTMTSALGMGLDSASKGPAVSPSSSASATPTPLPRATALTYTHLIYAFLMVPPSRGGPLLREAARVKDWLINDERAMTSVDKYKKPITRVLDLLDRVLLEEQEALSKAKEEISME
ncbi:hypothetical protein CBS101457_005928 [Exobasidium rhododendri]|nr:hypothetical protein CBS101457_005928 [Exobasidium rhododendri]